MANKETTCSIIVPIYNVIDYLKECLDSLVAQTCRDFEVIMVNDGSTDGSEIIAKEYQEKYPYFKLINQNNQGLSSARNAGLEIAKGQYVIFLDSDDYLESNAVEIIKEAVCDNVDVVIYEAVTFDEYCNEDYERYARLTSTDSIITGYEYLLNEQDKYNPSACLVAVNSKLIVDNNIRFIEKIIHEDNAYYYEVLSLSNRVRVLNESLYHRRVRGGSITGNYNYQKGTAGYIETVKALEGFAAKCNIRFLDEYKWIFTRLILNNYVICSLSEIKQICNELRWFQNWVRANNVKKSKRVAVFSVFPLVYKYENKLTRARWELKDEYSLVKRENGCIKRFFRLKHRKERAIILIGTPTHGNVGDHIIASQALSFLKESFEEEVFEISLYFYRRFRDSVMPLIREDDIICISGGGWMGDDWSLNEQTIRQILRDYKNNPVVIFPQTIRYSKGGLFMESAKNVYSTRNKFLLCVRDEKSAKIAVEVLGIDKDKVLLMPDLALLFETNITNEASNSIGVCIRDDREATISDTDVDSLKKQLVETGFNIKDVATNEVNRQVSLSSRDGYIDSKLNEIAKLDWLITDRLHGMIIAALVGTPCVALDNSNGKVKEVYKWIKNCPYIFMCDDIGDAIGIICKGVVKKHNVCGDLMVYNKILKKKMKEMI